MFFRSFEMTRYVAVYGYAWNLIVLILIIRNRSDRIIGHGKITCFRDNLEISLLKK